MLSTTYMPRTVSGPDEAGMFTVIYDFVPSGYRLDHAGRMTKPTGAVATGTWTAYRPLPDGTTERISGRGLLELDIEAALGVALAGA